MSIPTETSITRYQLIEATAVIDWLKTGKAIPFSKYPWVASAIADRTIGFCQLAQECENTHKNLGLIAGLSAEEANYCVDIMVRSVNLRLKKEKKDPVG